MRRKHIVRFTALAMAVLLMFTLGACGNKSNTIEEPEEITVEYLSGEYAEQLIRDGGECTLGTISIEENGDATSITVNGMVIVESDITEEGYYIADKNLSTTFPLSSEARVTYISDKEVGPEVMELDEFIQLIQNDTSDPLEVGNEKLYDVYTIGGNAMLILAKEMPVIE